jgi:hypothetical protein
VFWKQKNIFLLIRKNALAYYNAGVVAVNKKIAGFAPGLWLICIVTESYRVLSNVKRPFGNDNYKQQHFATLFSGAVRLFVIYGATLFSGAVRQFVTFETTHFFRSFTTPTIPCTATRALGSLLSDDRADGANATAIVRFAQHVFLEKGAFLEKGEGLFLVLRYFVEVQVTECYVVERYIVELYKNDIMSNWYIVEVIICRSGKLSML